MKTIVNYRKLWEIANSAVIPGGYHIHHKDGNRDNNSIENLICVSAEEHWRTHYEQGDPVALCGKFVQGAAEAGRKGGRAGKGWKYTPAQLENLIKARRESYKRMGGSKLKGRKLSDEIKNNI